MSERLGLGAAMTRRRFLRDVADRGAAIALGAVWDSRGPVTETGRTVVIDGLAFLDERGGPPGDELGPRALQAIRDCGITAVNVTVGTFGSGTGLFDRTLKDIERWEARLARYPDQLLKVRSAADIETARASGRLGIIYGFQDAAMLEGKADRVRQFRDLGVRIIQLTYNGRNELGDGALEREHRGLTEFGRTAVRRMNDEGVLVDLSHCGERTTTDAIGASRHPVAITHAGCAALAPNPRNKADDTLKRLADGGGVFGVYLMPLLRAKGQAYAEDVVAHVEHAWNVCGEDHVGIGTDGFIGEVELTPEYRQRLRDEVSRRRAAGIAAPGEGEDVVPLIPDLNEPRRLERLGALLRKRGHSADRVEKLLGRNFFRLTKQAWTA